LHSRSFGGGFPTYACKSNCIKLLSLSLTLKRQHLVTGSRQYALLLLQPFSPLLTQWNRPKMSGPGSVLHHALHRHLQEGGPTHRLFRCPATRGGHKIIIIIYSFFLYCIQHCIICRPSDCTVSEDAGIEPRTVATSALAVRRSNHYIG
jgi:hypothetical protein